MARILAVMGSGETTPTMTRHHRRLLEQAGEGQRVLLDSPYGFQENADDITARAVDYFSVSLVTDVVPVQLRKPDADARTVAAAMDAARRAAWFFTGPGSPTYAMRVWESTGLAPVVSDRLASGHGVTVFSSAAALTLGRFVVPVYEIYKVGADPWWADGLDVFRAATGFDAVVVPHYDNAEGGNHDTRFCYLGERRLRMLEDQLPDSTWVFGVDEHTAVLLDLEGAELEVVGKGGLTIRNRERSVTLPAGTRMVFGAVRQLADGSAGGHHVSGHHVTGHHVAGHHVAGHHVAGHHASGHHVAGHHTAGPDGSAGHHGADDSDGRSGTEGIHADLGLAEFARVAEARFDEALSDRDPDRAVDGALRLEGQLEAWKGDTSTTDERDRARAALHRMIVRLGELAVDGTRDPAELIGPFVQIALQERTNARAAKDYARSDAIRDALAAAGVEVRDTPQGQQWQLADREEQLT